MRTNGGACGPWMRWSKDQMMIDDDGGVMFNIACRLGTGTLWDAPRVFYCETPVSSVSRVMCNPELFICTNLLFDNTPSRDFLRSMIRDRRFFATPYRPLAILRPA